MEEEEDIPKMTPMHKFRAKPKTLDGIRFHSTKEADYYSGLLLKQKAGIVLYHHRQVPIALPGGVTYRVDFQEFHADGTVHYVENKGYETPEWKIKQRMVEALYPFTIEVK